jgi:hypothetical protein
MIAGDMAIEERDRSNTRLLGVAMPDEPDEPRTAASSPWILRTISGHIDSGTIDLTAAIIRTICTTISSMLVPLARARSRRCGKWCTGPSRCRRRAHSASAESVIGMVCTYRGTKPGHSG